MSDMDFFQIAALNFFAELGQLIEEDELKQTKFTDLPVAIINNRISAAPSRCGRVTSVLNSLVGK